MFDLFSIYVEKLVLVFFSKTSLNKTVLFKVIILKVLKITYPRIVYVGLLNFPCV